MSGLKRIQEEYRSVPPKEIWLGALENFIYGVVMTVAVSFVATGIDIAVLISYMVYFFFVGRVINRPKYVTSLGKFIVFPIPAALGAYTGFKIGYLISNLFT